ncbi:hypothetical protein VTJ04DRAFT_4398 [Mycothermus thermophilus]|uniref:uncharacterized protein n=1 Tax=Humicola insolens TaxID=85995 RepID=UPI00374432B8
MASSSSSIPRIAVLGSLNMDLVAYVPHHPLPGETLTAERFVNSPGGKGANQAVACAKLSRPRPSTGALDASTQFLNETAHITMLGAVGADAHGAALLDSLKSYGVDASGVQTAPEGVGSGVAVIIVDVPTGENRIVLSPGANHSVRAPEGASTAEEEEEWVIERLKAAGGGELPDMLIMQLEIPHGTVLAALRAARKHDVEVLLNPAPAAPLPEDAYKGLAHLVVNETEAAVLGGLGLEAAESLASDEKALESVAKGFLERGVGNVVITLGGKGVYYMAEGGGKKGWLPAEKAKVVDTTAAGDTFVGRYALEAAGSKKKGEERFDIEDAVRKANKAAAKTVERPGAQKSIPWRDELE